MRTINPATEEPLEEHPDDSPAAVQAKLRAAEHAFHEWRVTPLAQRSDLMHRAAEVLRAQAPALSLLMTHEMGKPIVAAEAEVEKCAAACDFFADHAGELL